MKINTDSGKPPQKQQIKVKAKQEIIVNRLTCATLEGVNARVIEVEATFTKGLPGFSVVGLASNDIQESKERVNNQSLFDTVKYNCTIYKSLAFRIIHGTRCLQ